MNYVPGLFLITFRRLAREKFYALICVLSLALGISGASIIGLNLHHELTFDQYHDNHEQIYRITTTMGSLLSGPVAGFEATEVLVRNNPQYLDYVRFQNADEKQFTFNNNQNTWDDTFLVDNSVFEYFTFDVKYGDFESAFTDPYSIAISDSFAQFYFGDRDPIGELISTERFEFRVTLVFEDLPKNVTHHYDALIPMAMLEVYDPDIRQNFTDMFIAMNGVSYLVVDESYDPDSIVAATDDLFENYFGDQFARFTGGLSRSAFSLNLQKISDIHFGPAMTLDVSGGQGAEVGNIVNVYLFAVVAVALLIIGTINYVNLATARASARTKEVAMKKILGASRSVLVKQFLAESLIFVAVAVWLGVSATSVALRLATIQAFTGGTGLESILLSPGSSAVFILAIITLAVVSGLYPAFYLTRQSTLDDLQARQDARSGGLVVRKALVLTQFTISLIIVACVFIMLRQSDFLTNSSMGFRKSNQMIVNLRGADVVQSREAIINELLQHPNIEQAVEMSRAFGRGISGISVSEVETESGESLTLRANSFDVGANFLEVMEVELVQGSMFRQGQNFDGQLPALVNETFVRTMEWEEPLGQTVNDRRIVGVVKDFHFLRLHEPIQPLLLNPYMDDYFDSLPERRKQSVSVDLVMSVSGNNEVELRTFIEDVVRRFSGQPVIEAVTLDSVWNELYAGDTQAVRLVGFFSALSIVISLLGLSGLAAYNTQLREKEIAIRKVLGASVSNLLALLSVDMAKILLVAIIPAVFGSYYLSAVWLERFAYRADFSLLPFVEAIGVIGGFAFVVLIAQTYRAAQANPVTKLKYE